MIQYVSIQESEKIVNQSAKIRKKIWRILFGLKQYNDSVLGWTGSTDTHFQLQLNFTTLEDALHFCNQKGYKVTHIDRAPQIKKIKKSYADNFKYARF